MFFFVCGQHTFSSPLKGYEKIKTLCFNCNNWNAVVLKQIPCFTLCWIPILPHTISGYKDVYCNTCHFTQPLETRPELIDQAEGRAPMHQGGPAQAGPPGGHGYPSNQPPPQGYYQPAPPGYHPQEQQQK